MKRFIDPKIVPDMDHTWFMLYHLYPHSEEFKETIRKEIEIAKKLKVKRIIVADNFKDMRIGDYKNVWHKDNFKFLIDLAHKNGIKIYPYFVLVEVADHSDVYRNHSEDWAVKMRFGRKFTGFMSVFHPKVYGGEYEFRSIIFCPSSGWGDYLVDNISYLIDEFKIDGVYIDRIDYRLKCRNRNHGGRGHFQRGIPEILQRISDEMKKRGDYNMIVNESCIKVDDILAKCVKISDSVLVEVLPTYFVNKNPLFKIFGYFLGGITWRIRDKISPYMLKINNQFYNTDSMASTDWMTHLVDRIKKIGGKDIMIFSQNYSEEGFRTVVETSKNTGASICYITGTERLSDVVKI